MRPPTYGQEDHIATKRSHPDKIVFISPLLYSGPGIPLDILEYWQDRAFVLQVILVAAKGKLTSGARPIGDRRRRSPEIKPP